MTSKPMTPERLRWLEDVVDASGGYDCSPYKGYARELLAEIRRLQALVESVPSKESVEPTDRDQDIATEAYAFSCASRADGVKAQVTLGDMGRRIAAYRVECTSRLQSQIKRLVERNRVLEGLLEKACAELAQRDEKIAYAGGVELMLGDALATNRALRAEVVSLRAELAAARSPEGVCRAFESLVKAAMGEEAGAYEMRQLLRRKTPDGSDLASAMAKLAPQTSGEKEG